jgi:hypothetical protein
MKKLLTLAVCVMAIGVAGNALAVIDWAGNVWPNSGASVTPTGPVDVYAQVFKGGVTDAPGQGADISAVLFYTTDIAAQATAPLVFLGDNGASNDEYTGQVPQAALLGAAWVDVTIVFTDATDASEFEVTGDQGGNVPPFRYNVTDVLPNDVTVRFTLCMSGVETIGDPCVIGSAAEIGAWVTGVNMAATATPGLYSVDIVFPAGGNPSFEYKFKKDACVNWEGTGNRLVTLPTDGTTLVELGPDSWEFLPLTCGLGNTLEEDKEICFQVCMDGVETAGGVCTVGGIPELDNWGNGTQAIPVGLNLYQTCVTFPAGTAIPLNIEYKFKKDACATWESVGNRLIVLDNSLSAETTVTHSWDDGPGICQPVGVEETAWGTIKGMYR